MSKVEVKNIVIVVVGRAITIERQLRKEAKNYTNNEAKNKEDLLHKEH